MKHLSSAVANFHFENAQAITYGGELLQGEVRGRAYRTIRVKNVKVTLTCEFGHADSSTQASDVMILHTATETVWEGSRLASGDYAFPFSFFITADLPPSLETASKDKHIRWRLTATCEHAEEEESVVLCSAVFNKGQKRSLPSKTNETRDVPFTFVCTKDKQVYLFVQLDKDTFVRDEPVRVRVHVHNKEGSEGDGRRISFVTVTAVQTEMLAGPGEPHTSRKHVLDEAQCDYDDKEQAAAKEMSHAFTMMPSVSNETGAGAVCAFGPGTYPDLVGTDEHQLSRHTRRLAPSVMYHDLRGGNRGGVMLLVSYAVHVSCQLVGAGDERLTVTMPITIADAVG